jgi:tight adherence protein C
MGVLVNIAILALVFAAVVGSTLFLSQKVQLAVTVRRRLAGHDAADRGRADSVVKRTEVRNPLLAWVQSSSSISDSKDRKKLAKALAKAGFEHPAAPAVFVVIRFAAAIGLPLAFLLLQALFPSPLTGMKQILVALGLCGAGLLAPRAVIDRIARHRRDQLEREFPDALDLLVVCVEAGLGLEAAIIRVGDEVNESHPRICGLFGEMSAEMRAGRGRADALRNLGDRAEVESVRAFATLMIQTDALGTSIGQTLRTFSAEMRETRFMSAEEKAMRIPVLLTIPLVACILPVIVTALLLPGGLDVARDLLPALKSGGG